VVGGSVVVEEGESCMEVTSSSAVQAGGGIGCVGWGLGGIGHVSVSEVRSTSAGVARVGS
jgi:hypothetical protein